MKQGLLPFWLAALAASAQQPKFEIVDVHASPTSHTFAGSNGGVLRAGRYVDRDATILDLIEAAYGLSDDTVIGGPGWISSDLFDVIAKFPEGTKPADTSLMLQSVLADRFGLVVRHEMHPVARYVLTVAKGGPKLETAAPSEHPDCQQIQQPGGSGTPGDTASIPNRRVACHNLTAAAIAENLHQWARDYPDHEVMDSTKLEGAFDFDLEWTPRAAVAKGPDGVSIFNAVENQLGLKLELQEVPLPALVVEHINRKPSPNPAGIATALALPAARFEAASIKPADPDQPDRAGNIGIGTSEIGVGGTLRDLIAMALEITPNIAADTIIGLPKSAHTRQWRIDAKLPSSGEGAPDVVNGQLLPPPVSVMLVMLRGLLVEQFALKTHTENREVTVYALTTGSGKPKLVRANESDRSGCKPDPLAPKPIPNISTMIACKNTTMVELAEYLQLRAHAFIDHPIVDATGLKGGWNFMIGWAQPNQPAAATGEATDPNSIPVFEALERELGLKLVKQKRSIPVVVIDHVSETPIG